MTIDNTNIPFADKVQLLPIRDQLALGALRGCIDITQDAQDYDRQITMATELAYKYADAMLQARAK